MKRLLTILSVLGISVTLTANAVSCNMHNRYTEDISRIQKKLSLLLYSRPEISEA